MSYHFIGIGGIGMSALAKILLEKGEKVQGSDLFLGKTIEELQKRGAKIYIGHDSALLKEGMKVVISSAIDKTNEELILAKKLSLPIYHRSDLLKELTRGYESIVIAGTHGKTTTTGLLATVLFYAKKDPSYVIGGICRCLKSNAHSGKGRYFVLEADESDGSFLKTDPFSAIVTNAEREHIDYWKEEEKLFDAFKEFCKKVKRDLFWCNEDPVLQKIKPKGFSYGVKDADLLIENILKTGFSMSFDIKFEKKLYEKILIPLIGRHNVFNAAAVFGLSLKLGIEERVIREAFSFFQNSERRAEHKGLVSSLDFYDDYAHHPTEIRKTLEAFRGAIKERRLVVLFQPHRYSRTKDLLPLFKDAFLEADQVLITDIYAAFEKEESIHAKDLVENIHSPKVRYVPKAKLLKEAVKVLKPHDVVLTMGAGDITKINIPLQEAYRKALEPPTNGNPER